MSRYRGIPDSPPSIDAQAVSAALGVSLRTWALRRGYRPGTVYACLQAWGWRSEQEPHGGLARQIMRDLTRDLPAGALRRIAAASATQRRAA